MKKLSILATFALTAISAFADTAVYPEPVLGTDYTLSPDKCTATILTVNALAKYQELPAECGGIKNYVLGADIQVGTEKPQQGCTTNLAIYNTGLTGNFDGKHHTISNVCVSEQYNTASLFGAVGSKLTIKNLNIDGVYIYSGANNGNVSALVSEASSDLTLDSVHVKNAVVNAYNTSVGGLVGATNNNTALVIENSSFEGQVTRESGNSESAVAVGGLVGKILGKVKIESSHFKGEMDITSTQAKVNVGGLIGVYSAEDTIVVFKSYATNQKNLSSEKLISLTLANAVGYNVGGFIGNLKTYFSIANSKPYVYIHEVFAKGSINVEGSVSGSTNNYIGGLIGWDENANWYKLNNAFYMGSLVSSATGGSQKIFGLTNTASTYSQMSKTGTGNYNGNVRNSFAYVKNASTQNITGGLANWGEWTDWPTGKDSKHGQYTLAITSSPTTPVPVIDNVDGSGNETMVLASKEFADLLETYDDSTYTTWYYASDMNEGFPSLVNVGAPELKVNNSIEGLKIEGTQFTNGETYNTTLSSSGTLPRLKSISFVGGTGYLTVKYNGNTKYVAYGETISDVSGISEIEVAPVATFDVTLANITAIDVSVPEKLIKSYSTTLNKENSKIPNVGSFIIKKPENAAEDYAYVVFETEAAKSASVKVEYGNPVEIPAGAISAEIYAVASYKISVVDTADFNPIFKVAGTEFPSTYTVFGESVKFPKIASLDACFMGWKVNGNELSETLEWDPEGTFGDIEASPIFDDTKLCNVTVALNDKSEFGVEWEVKYEDNVIDVLDGKFEIPDFAGIEYTVSAVAKAENESVTEISWNGSSVVSSITYTGNEAALELTAKATKDFYYVTFISNETVIAKGKTGTSHQITSVKDGDKWVAVSAELLPYGSYKFDSETKSATYFANGETLWKADLEESYTETVVYTENSIDLSNITFVASNDKKLEELDQIVWNGSDFNVITDEFPTVIYANEKGVFNIANEWNVSANNVPAVAVTDVIDVAEFARKNHNVVNSEGFNFVLDLSKAKDYNLAIKVVELKNVTAVCEIFGEQHKFTIEKGEGNIPQCAEVVFEGNQNDSLKLLLGDVVSMIAYGDVIKVPAGTTALGVSEKEAEPELPEPIEPGVFSVDSISIAHSGSAVKITGFTTIDSKLPVELRVKLYSADTVVIDTVLADSAEAGESVLEIYPLAPGEYYAEATLIGIKDTVSLASEPWIIGDVVAILAAGEWNMLSLANVSEDFRIPTKDEGEIFAWDEDDPIGDFWQYKAVESIENIKASTGYWVLAEDTTVVKAASAPAKPESDTIAWDLKSNYSGWNMIANPYSWKIALNASDFTSAENEEEPFWRWNPETAQYEPVSVLDENAAIWVKTDEAKTLALDVRPVYNVKTEAATEDKPVEKSSWSLRLKLLGENGKADSWNVVGVGSREINIDEPPTAFASGVSLAIVDGNKNLAKAIRNSNENASWNMAFKASNLQRAKVSVDGLEELEKQGFYATLTVDGNTTRLSAKEGVDVTLSTTSKNATLNVLPLGTIAQKSLISNLRYALDGNKMNFTFDIPENAAGKMFEVRLVDIHGKTVSMARENSVSGKNTAMLTKPANSGIYFVRVSLAGSTKQMKIKF